MLCRNAQSACSTAKHSSSAYTKQLTRKIDFQSTRDSMSLHCTYTAKTFQVDDIEYTTQKKKMIPFSIDAANY